MHPILSLLFQSPYEVINYGIEKILAFFARLLQSSIVYHFKQVTNSHVGVKTYNKTPSNGNHDITMVDYFKICFLVSY
jgi:hypothetical protein